MMEIHRLPEGLARKIAAGEVIERPESVVKELMENCIDAGAHSIEVELMQGGKVLISVKDDGCGIIPDELPLAVEKHATSKISEETDLESIVTLGYRGEALSSIAAVSHFEIYSRRSELPEGATLRMESGVPKVTPVPLRPGTTVIVKDLFYNLPARRKFLKSATAEFRRISRLIQDYAFAYPHIAFSLLHDGKVAFKSSGSGSLEKLVAQVWGSEPRARAAQYEAGASAAQIWWQDLGPQSRFQLISFVNGRRVNNSVLRAAIQGFNWAGRGNWLAMLSVPPQEVDVNIHPAKAEILFRHSGDVYELVRRTAEQFSRDYSEVPVAARTKTEAKSFSASDFDVRPRNAAPSEPYRPTHESHPFTRMEVPQFRVASTAPKLREMSTGRLPFESFRERVAPAEESEPAMVNGRIYMGQLPQGYLLFANAEELLIVDPHAAHERVNYEKILHACSDPHGQEHLLMPIRLTPTLKDEALAHREALSGLNFTVDDDGALTGIPLHAKAVGISPAELLRSAIGAIEEGKEQSQSLQHVFATKACKASVKLTTRLETPEALQLLSDLEACDEPNACPHGRPTVLRIKASALDKHFGRLGL